MGWSWAKERAYWKGECARFWKLGALLIVVALAFWPFYVLPGVSTTVNCLFAVMLGVIVVRRLIRGRNLDAVLTRRWQSEMSRRLRALWPDLVVNLKLSVRKADGQHTTAGMGQPWWEGWSCMIPLVLPVGLVRDDVAAACPQIREAFGAARVSVVGEQAGALALRVDYVDALAQPFAVRNDVTWDGRSVAMGQAEGGVEWRLPIGPHTLVAGASGSGKASLVWGLLLGLRTPIRDGVIEVWGIDRKGGMELAMGRPLLARFADDAIHSVALLEDAVVQMQRRARELAGVTRQHVATVESPTVIILIDELAALTAYENDRDMLRRANAAIATLASQGRAVGFIVFACLQDPRKETLPARGLFTQTVGLRLRDRMETAMVLGDSAVAAGALCHRISPRSPGIAYVLPEDGSSPIRVRAGYASDDQIRAVAHHYAAPNPRPVAIPAEPAERTTGRRSRGRRQKASTTEAS